jgi:triphosphoribosyl-dephospho-CoA synthase
VPEPAHSAAAARERARVAFLRACRLDVQVRKPGNVSRASAGHRMQADMFIASAQAAAPALFAQGQGVGARVEGAVAASMQAAGCNTNLGIVLLCAPLAVAAERKPDARTPQALRAAVGAVLEGLDVEDARHAFRAIALANPGGLGSVDEHDVRGEPDIDLLGAMRAAADRDSVARQYANGFADLFDSGLRAAGGVDFNDAESAARATQCIYLGFLAGWPDSHIVRKLGATVAQTVMADAAAWLERALEGEALDADSRFVRWDEDLKAAGINPGTSADLTVATLMLAGLLTPLDDPGGRLFPGGTERVSF